IGNENDSLNNDVAAGVPSQARYKAPIDFDRVEWEASEISERRVAGSKIVHGDVYAKLLQFMKAMDCLLILLKEYPFGDFEHESVWRQTRIGQDLRYSIRQLLVQELHRGNIDRDLHRVGPLSSGAARLRQHPLAESDKKATVLRHGNELRRRN